ncbi:hypothetical protein BKA59DRAFT_556128 [Fusarium tricinctum]|uniref:Uncharacterized protein n=1 Tax=Fusarium tricinctum TaxID=61284 RepID=A0A8K0RY00_9HYPO|nr:hypothetical protein BKA59DRAFT_556128 [Fusarium tricinctum]
MAISDPTPQPSAAPKLPLDVLYNIGLILAEAPLEEAKAYVDSDYQPYLMPGHTWDGTWTNPLHKFTYLSKTTKALLEPLLYRHLILYRPQDVTNFFITLIKRPEIRQHVQDISAFPDMTGPIVRKLYLPACKKIWAARCPSDKPALMRLLDGAGLQKLAWSACMLERTKQRFMFSPDFKHDGILELMFAGILFLTPNVTEFHWRDSNTNPKAFILDRIMGETVDAGVPLMPKLKVLSTEKAAFEFSKQAQFFTPHIGLWDNLHTLHLNDIDLDVEFIEMLVAGEFKENRPVKELYISCVSGSEIPYSLRSFPPDFELSSTLLLNQDEPDLDKAKFKAFPNLTLLDVCFVHHVQRLHTGSPTLRSFLHAVGCPERIHLAGHTLPINAFNTGVIHPKLKYLKVREFQPDAPARTAERDVLVAGLNRFWQEQCHVVPNLCEIDWDHYKFKREDLEGEERAVWGVVGEEEWEDESGVDSDDDDFVIEEDEDDLYFLENDDLQGPWDHDPHGIMSHFLDD